MGQVNPCSTHEISQIVTRFNRTDACQEACWVKEVIRPIECPEKERRGITLDLVVLRKVG
jgi:hypothetical protein